MSESLSYKLRDVAASLDHRDHLDTQFGWALFEVMPNRGLNVSCGICSKDVARFPPGDNNEPATFKGLDVQAAIERHACIYHPKARM